MDLLCPRDAEADEAAAFGGGSGAARGKRGLEAAAAAARTAVPGVDLAAADDVDAAACCELEPVVGLDSTAVAEEVVVAGAGAKFRVAGVSTARMARATIAGAGVRGIDALRGRLLPKETSADGAAVEPGSKLGAGAAANSEAIAEGAAATVLMAEYVVFAAALVEAFTGAVLDLIDDDNGSSGAF